MVFIEQFTLPGLGVEMSKTTLYSQYRILIRKTFVVSIRLHWLYIKSVILREFTISKLCFATILNNKPVDVCNHSWKSELSLSIGLVWPNLFLPVYNWVYWPFIPPSWPKLFYIGRRSKTSYSSPELKRQVEDLNKRRYNEENPSEVLHRSVGGHQDTKIL